MENIESKKKVGRPKGSKNKVGVKTGRPKGSTKPLEEVRKNSFSVRLSKSEYEELKSVLTLEEFKNLNNRMFLMKMLEIIKKL